ncbi:phage antirepressor N-terminal domain-containing protein [Streptomyces albidoflavus]|uniref:phage antirepressor N-terminal domain-containing protein n=1 Tax=Streptomyces albidoflavus TaxID=1886 RepID=UPI0033CF7C0A
MSPIIPQPSEVVKLYLSAGSVHTVLVDGQPHVLLRPAIEALGLDWKNQYEKLKTRSWGSVVQSTTQVPGDAQTRTHTVAPVRTFLMLLATINENRVKESVRPALVAFQNETADAIEAYWTQGGAINPRATTDQLDSLVARAKQQAEVLSILSGIVSPDWLETKARQSAVHGASWSAAIPRRGGGIAWTREGWQEAISALSVDRLFCWPDARTAIEETRRALDGPAAEAGESR